MGILDENEGALKVEEKQNGVGRQEGNKLLLIYEGLFLSKSSKLPSFLMLNIHDEGEMINV